MRVLVCGGRDYGKTSDEVATIADALAVLPEDTVLIHGDARGADRLAGDIWAAWGSPMEVYPADWKTHKKAAGPIRNQQMLDTGIDLVIAFPGGAGTADMMRRARKAGVTVKEV